MTIRLYWEDSYLREFSGRVVQTTQVRGNPAVTLDRTIFYPTSGGQPYDTGGLGSARVLEVEEDDTGNILHILDLALQPGPVSGAIDWERRFDHMQQHTGQHILSQAFLRVSRSPTISFHLGVETSTIDIELKEPTEAIMRDAENLASRTVFEDRSVHVIHALTEQLEELGLRKQSQRGGVIRVIDVEDFDRSPCGGTHVRRSGEIGAIGVLGYERYKGGTRVEFVCGGRILRTLRRDHQTLKQLGRIHSGHIYELPRLAEKSSQDRASLVRENARLREELIELEARELLRQQRPESDRVLVRRTFSGRSLESLKVLAQKLTAQGRAIAIFGLAGDPAQAIVARSNDLEGDCGSAVRRIAAQHGGRGGGRAELAQAGGIPAAALESWLVAMENCLKQ